MGWNIQIQKQNCGREDQRWSDGRKGVRERRSRNTTNMEAGSIDEKRDRQRVLGERRERR